MHRGGGMAVADRILRISTTFRRSIERLGIKAGSPAYRAVSAAMRALPTTDLPGPGDFETAFAPTSLMCAGSPVSTSDCSIASTIAICSS